MRKYYFDINIRMEKNINISNFMISSYDFIKILYTKLVNSLTKCKIGC